MNRFYYINKIYDYILEKRRPKKKGTKKLIESLNLKKHIEAGLMYTFYVELEGGKEREVVSYSPVYESVLWKPTLKDAYDTFFEWLNDHENMINTLLTNEAIQKWAKKNKKLLKLN